MKYLLPSSLQSLVNLDVRSAFVQRVSTIEFVHTQSLFGKAEAFFCFSFSSQIFDRVFMKSTLIYHS